MLAASAVSLADVIWGPPLSLKPAQPPPIAPAASEAPDLVCPCCHGPCQAGEAFCNECGAALDPAVEAVLAPAQAVPAVKAARRVVRRTPSPQFMSLLFVHQIILGRPALGSLGKSVVMLVLVGVTNMLCWLVIEGALWCDRRVMEGDATLGVFCRRWGVPLIAGGTIRLPR